MSRVLEKTVYKFDELSEAAKEKAREWFREIDEFDYESVYEDAATCAQILGIDLRQTPVKTMGGSTRYDPAIYFSGFFSQGDGACFDGSYSYAKEASKKIRKHAPSDSELHRIADELQALQRRNFYKLEAECKHRGHYYHSGCMAVDISESRTAEDKEELTQLLRDFADWIFGQLRTEYEWRTADEQVDESILANEYEFDESGRLAK